MFLSKWMQVMFDGTTIEFHLIDNSFRISDNAVCILTIEAIKSLPESELTELISVQDDIFLAFNHGYFHDAKINPLKLPYKNIDEYKWNNTDVG